jgi:hypothetical protein
MRKTQLFNSAVLTLLVFGIALTNIAAASGELGLSDFTSKTSNPVDGVGDAKPLFLEVIAIVIGIFVISSILAIFASGSTANVGSILHNITLRSKGIGGVVIVLGVIFAVISTLIIFFHLYNTYLVGK